MMRRRSDLPVATPQAWSTLIPADTFYARLAQWRDTLVDDEAYRPLYPTFRTLKLEMRNFAVIVKSESAARG